MAHNDVTLISLNDVTNLPKGQAFCLFEGGKPFKIRIPLPKPEPMNIPAEIGALLKYMYNRFTNFFGGKPLKIHKIKKWWSILRDLIIR